MGIRRAITTMLAMGMVSREELFVVQDKNETLGGFGVRLIDICWVPTVYKHWAKDLGPRIWGGL